MLPRSKRIGLLLLAVAVAVLAVGYYFVDPAQSVWVPKCPFRLLTGFDCPACGNQRALHALLHGEWLAALRFNPFVLLSLPYLAAVVYTSCAHGERALRLRPLVQHPTVVRCYLVLVLVWWVVRNTACWHAWIG